MSATYGLGMKTKLNTDALRQLADDIDEYGEEGAIERWEWQPMLTGEWTYCTTLPTTYRILEGKARRKPQTIIVNGVEVPEPLRELNLGQKCWLAANTNREPYRFTCQGLECEQLWLLRGYLHATKKAAQKHMDALKLPSRVDGGKS
jgi:hypothetical protein